MLDLLISSAAKCAFQRSKTVNFTFYRLNAARILIAGCTGLAAEVSNLKQFLCCKLPAALQSLPTVLHACYAKQAFMQVAKNIVLAGVGSLALMDATKCASADPGNFLIPADADPAIRYTAQLLQLQLICMCKVHQLAAGFLW